MGMPRPVSTSDGAAPATGLGHGMGEMGAVPRPVVAQMQEPMPMSMPDSSMSAMQPMVRQRRDMFDALIALGAGVGLPAALRRITEVARDVTGARYGVFAATAASRGSVPAVLRADLL